MTEWVLTYNCIYSNIISFKFFDQIVSDSFLAREFLALLFWMNDALGCKVILRKEKRFFTFQKRANEISRNLSHFSLSVSNLVLYITHLVFLSWHFKCSIFHNCAKNLLGIFQYFYFQIFNINVQIFIYIVKLQKIWYMCNTFITYVYLNKLSSKQKRSCVKILKVLF